jgi:hypothetical protein
VSSRSSEQTRDEGGESERRLGMVSGFRDRVRVIN